MSIFTRLPWNSQVKIANVPSMEKSAWLTPAQSGDVERALERHRLRVEEVEALARLGDDDRRLAVGREVHVVRVVDGRTGPPGLPVFGSIGVSVPSVRALGVVRDPQRLEVPRRHDVLRVQARPSKVSTTCIVAGSITDTVFDAAVRHVDAGRARPSTASAELAGACLAVEVDGSGTPGMPGIVSIFFGASVAAVGAVVLAGSTCPATWWSSTDAWSEPPPPLHADREQRRRP